MVPGLRRETEPLRNDDPGLLEPSTECDTEVDDQQPQHEFRAGFCHASALLTDILDYLPEV
jgi:hypothetical protein